MLKLKFNEEGLVPVIAQDYRTGEIRMFAWANEEAIKKTLETGYAHYYSRSRKALWKKGETSGELQKVLEIRVDCDEDVILYMVEQEKNTACHTGRRNCFFVDIRGQEIKSIMPFEALQRLQEVIQKRLMEMPEGSYTVRLYKEGEDRILKKFGEEAIETLIALKRGVPEEIKAEACDMLYHFLLMLTVRNVGIEEVLQELASRIK
ncbi:MAG: bifunctional phosphoribosyl-AMP cyclohydrolase/phosphoribosyl-ATP diphosphatase HisIE [Aquificaceae bacterium]|nr:bifunctional phosphoribosyl-AMP cyclohydrolase/phosphoribosyl-ATP diphosphatase HisIE [Aquificaceae bacterium]